MFYCLFCNSFQTATQTAAQTPNGGLKIYGSPHHTLFGAWVYDLHLFGTKFQKIIENTQDNRKNKQKSAVLEPLRP